MTAPWSGLSILSVVLVFCLQGGGTPVNGAEPAFPAEVGTRWTYVANQAEVIEEIVAIDEISGERCLKVETSVNGQVLSFEHLAVRPDGLYRVSIGGEKVVPPLCFFKFTPRSGEKWSVKSKVGELDVTGEFVAGTSLVSVPAGRYTVTTSRGSKFQSPSGEIDFTYFYAPGVGKVKQVIQVGRNSSQLVLKEFRPAAQP